MYIKKSLRAEVLRTKLRLGRFLSTKMIVAGGSRCLLRIAVDGPCVPNGNVPGVGLTVEFVRYWGQATLAVVV